MKKTIVLIFALGFITSIKAQLIKVYTEEFLQYDNVWKQMFNDTCTLSVTSGKYIINHNKTPGYTLYTTEYKKIDARRDFAIKAAILHTSGDENQYFGLCWGFEDVNNNFSFGITASSNYRVIKQDKGKTIVLKSGSNPIII